MPDFIFSRGTFYAITLEGEADFPEQIHIDGVCIAHQSGDVAVAEKFRTWINTSG